MKFNVNWLSDYVLSQDSVTRCMFVSACAYSREVVFSCLHAGCGACSYTYEAGQSAEAMYTEKPMMCSMTCSSDIAAAALMPFGC